MCDNKRAIEAEEAHLMALRDVDRLRSLVVMGSHHDDVPVFEQGYKEHECLQPVTAALCNHMVEVIEKYAAALKEIRDIRTSDASQNHAALIHACLVASKALSS